MPKRSNALRASLPTTAPFKLDRTNECAHESALKAYSLLAEQPVSLNNLSWMQRERVVVSAVLDDVGSIIVVSRVGDDVWDLWPFVYTPNTKASEKSLDWTGIPELYRETVQNVLYAYWKRGRKGLAAPCASSLRRSLYGLQLFCRFAARLNLRSLSDVQPLHIANFVHQQKSTGKAPISLAKIFSAVELIWLFRDEHESTLSFHPWPESSAGVLAGFTGTGGVRGRKVALTPLIPDEVAKTLFRHAEGILNQADGWLDARERGERSVFKDPEIISIRDACFFLIGVLTGMRQSEISSIEVGAGRTEVINRVTYHWLAATEYKTGKGDVDYLMPAMGHRILNVMERWSKPYRQRLEEQIAVIENEQAARSTTKDMKWLATARSNLRRLFLGKGNGGIVPVSQAAWNINLKAFAQKADTSWDLASHQMRRLYAYTFVKHKLGSGNLLWLKEQFKHTSIDMSQLYAANPRQDAALYDDILSESLRYKVEVICTWLDKDEPLAGWAGKRIMGNRDTINPQDFADRRALVEETTQRVLLRSNGHAWCLAQDQGCGGSGIYERFRCGGCQNAVIDRNFAPVLKEAYRHHLELLREAQQWGPGAVKRVEKDLKQVAQILRDLEIDMEEGNCDAQSA
jgi:site-specific recombinase XerC